MPPTEPAPQGAIRVAICDDSIGFRSLVRSWIRSDPELELAGEADDGATVRRLVADVRPDVLVLDLVLPDVDDPAALAADLRDAHPPLRIVLMSSLQEGRLGEAAAATGADAHLHKATTAQELCALVRRTARTPPEPAGA